MGRCFLLAAIAAAACGGYDAPSEVVYGTLAYSQANPDALNKFPSLRTYYLDPLVEVWLDGEQQVSQPVPAATVTVIQTNMTKYGYTQVTTNPGPGQNPNADVGLRLAYLKSTTVYYYSGGYCSIYWAYYACWPGWAYAGAYTSGTVIGLMLDTKASVGGHILWAIGLYGVLSGTTLDNTTRLNDALNRAYAQSPYLKTSVAP
jgi:hypothetical protein